MLLSQITIDLPHGGKVNVPIPEEAALWHTNASDLMQRYPFVCVLLSLILLDILTGVIAGYICRKLCSTSSFRGMVGKVQILAMVATAMLMELIVPNVPWGTFVAIFFCVTEAISITENAANSGVPIPKPWVEALQKAKAEAESRRASALVIIETGNDASKEIKPAIQEAVHVIRDDIHAASMRAHGDAMEAKAERQDAKPSPVDFK